MPDTIQSHAVTITRPAQGDNLFDQEEAVHSKIAERAFELFQARGSVDGSDWNDWLNAESELIKPVALEVSESEDQFAVSAEVPGFRPKDFEIQLDGSRMVIHGLRTGDGKEGVESTDGETSPQIFRLVEFSSPVSAAGSHAEVEDGILQITLPKSKEQTGPPSA